MAEKLTGTQHEELQNSLRSLGERAVEVGNGVRIMGYTEPRRDYGTVGYLTRLSPNEQDGHSRILAWLLDDPNTPDTDETTFMLGTYRHDGNWFFRDSILLAPEPSSQRLEQVLAATLGDRYDLVTTQTTEGAGELVPQIGHLLAEVRTAVDSLLVQKHAAEEEFAATRDKVLRNAYAALAVNSATGSSSEA